MILNWVRCDRGVWCPFETVNLANVTASGVYIIWHAGQNPRTVRIGQGNIAERIRVHRNDAEVTQFRQFGALCVTWAAVDARSHDGVENYLADLLNPLVGERFPNVQPIAVNSPFE